MATRSRTRFSRGRGTRKRAVWVNIPFGNLGYSETANALILLTPEDWEASFTGLTNESATLRAIVGQIHIVQNTAGTRGGDMFWGIYMHGASDITVPTFSTSGMSEYTWLRTGSRAVSSVITDGLQMSQIYCAVEEINIKARRKLTSAVNISICAQFGADPGAAPTGIIGGLLRFLVARD